MDNLSGIKEYNYLYVNRTNNYPQNIGDTIVLSESYSKYHFINIEAVELDLEATTTSEIDTITFEE